MSSRRAVLLTYFLDLGTLVKEYDYEMSESAVSKGPEEEGGETPFVKVVFRLESMIQMSSVHRARNKGLYVVARNFFLLLLNCSAWPCLAVA